MPFDPDTVEIVQVVKPTRLRTGDILRHHRPELADSDIDWVDGMPVTTAHRTVLDCLCALPPRAGLVLADAAFRDLAHVDVFDRAASLAREEELRATLRHALDALGAVRGVRRAREVLSVATGLSASPGESRTRWLGLAVGLPVPVCQWESWVGSHRYFSDVAWLRTGPDWPHRAITFEYDGAGKYGRSAADAVGVLASEKDREDDIRTLGVAVHRVTKQRLANTRAAGAWMLAKFPPSVRADLTPRPLLRVPPRS